MKLTHNQLAISAAALVIAGLLVVLSVLYFRAQKPKPVHSAQPVAEQPVKPQKLTKEEREARQLERQAEVVGVKPEELAEAANEPEKLIDQTMEREEGRTQEEKMSDLIHQRRQLEKMPAEHATRALEKVVDFLETRSDRATNAQREVSPDQFDADSAQIDSCERVAKDEKDGGGWRYIATLVDANGNSMKVELPESEGASTWRTMQMLKENPIMNAIYRKAVMPLLDRKMEKEKKTEKTKKGEGANP